MSIECKPASSTVHKQDGVHAKGAKAKANGPDTAKDDGGNGFKALLSAQEDDGADSVSTPADNGAVAMPSGPLQTATATSDVPPAPADGSVAGAFPNALPNTAVPSNVNGAAVDGLRVGAGQPGPGEAAVSDIKGEREGQEADASLLGPLQHAAGGKGGAGRLADGQADAGTEAASGAQGKDFRRMMAKAKADKAVDTSDAGAQLGSAGTGKGAAEARDAKLMAAMDIQKLLQPLAKDEVAVIPTLARDEKRAAERSVFAAAADTPQNAAPQATGSSEHTDIGFSAVTDVAAPPEVQVAEQVQFWISQDVQSAEMQLDGLGEKPVEVSITLHGNEAHVAFRSDELLARGVLEGAETHLREMLGREGVVLTGMSVGTSSGNGTDDGGRQSRQGERRQAAVMPVVAAEARVQRSNFGVAGRSLDLFV